jgi:hypothetical protein
MKKVPIMMEIGRKDTREFFICGIAAKIWVTFNMEEGKEMDPWEGMMVLKYISKETEKQLGEGGGDGPVDDMCNGDFEGIGLFVLGIDRMVGARWRLGRGPLRSRRLDR